MISRQSNHEWHVALNKFNTVAKVEFQHWMYDAKAASTEVPRLALLFRQEREGQLPKQYQQCSHSDPAPVVDNKLTCCIGQVCKECPYLLAIDEATMSPEEKDEAKAWTCVGHILGTKDLDTSEGFILTEDDRMFWSNLYKNMSAQDPEEQSWAESEVKK